MTEATVSVHPHSLQGAASQDVIDVVVVASWESGQIWDYEVLNTVLNVLFIRRWTSSHKSTSVGMRGTATPAV